MNDCTSSPLHFTSTQGSGGEKITKGDAPPTTPNRNASALERSGSHNATPDTLGKTGRRALEGHRSQSRAWAQEQKKLPREFLPRGRGAPRWWSSEAEDNEARILNLKTHTHIAHSRPRHTTPAVLLLLATLRVPWPCPRPWRHHPPLGPLSITRPGEQ